jgi:hypothetical protein
VQITDNGAGARGEVDEPSGAVEAGELADLERAYLSG